MAKKSVKTRITRSRAARSRVREDNEAKTANPDAEAVEAADDTDEDDEETPGEEARSVVQEVRRDRVQAQRRTMIEREEADEEQRRKDATPDEDEITFHDGKPGSGAGLKPGDWHAPRSNPGAAARVPSQPLQPESLQSHGLGILHDKDLDNPPFGVDDPEAVDAGPSGTPAEADKAGERKKADKASGRFKQIDPDNPTIGAGGRKDATASPNPIGSRHASKADVSGGSNSGIDS